MSPRVALLAEVEDRLRGACLAAMAAGVPVAHIADAAGQYALGDLTIQAAADDGRPVADLAATWQLSATRIRQILQ
ncbi:hypothetical protein [Actinomyces procaprae]|uniref:hypothetical protein n=1 Tax=Actinomyces procaprae TaxID=2560010 RepID=UPI0010A2A6EA|nr:hypothetical protein [Actinomyces procaprae]